MVNLCNNAVTNRQLTLFDLDIYSSQEEFIDSYEGNPVERGPSGDEFEQFELDFSKDLASLHTFETYREAA